MGVDWMACDTCGETFPDCGDYVYCNCGRNWCSYECANEDGFTELDEDEYPDLDEDERKSCKFCREEDFTDEELLVSLMDYHELTRNDVIKIHKFLQSEMK